MADPYRPDLAIFCNILLDYSRHGLAYFKRQSSQMQGKMRASLGGYLEDNGDQIAWKLARISKGNQSQLRFLPMPRPGGNDFKASFFLPRITRNDDESYTCSFIVVFWVDRDNGKTMAVRFEPSGGLGDPHAYTHLQLTRKVTDPNITTSFEPWVPDSYPAFPLGYDHPLQLFVGMAVAVHGYSASNKREYVRAAIMDSMVMASRARRILEEAKSMLERNTL